MKSLNRKLRVTLFVLPTLVASLGRAQTETQKTEKKAAASPNASAQEKQESSIE